MLSVKSAHSARKEVVHPDASSIVLSICASFFVNCVCFESIISMITIYFVYKRVGAFVIFIRACVRKVY